MNERKLRECIPDDFMFEMTKDEQEILRSQFVTSSWGGTRYLPMAFTEQGVAMLSSVLNSKRPIQVNIQIMRAFTKLRQMLWPSMTTCVGKSRTWKPSTTTSSPL